MNVWMKTIMLNRKGELYNMMCNMMNVDGMSKDGMKSLVLDVLNEFLEDMEETENE